MEKDQKSRWLTPAAARINKGLTQEQAAKKLRISKYRLSRMEKGEIAWPASLLWDMKELYEVQPPTIEVFKV